MLCREMPCHPCEAGQGQGAASYGVLFRRAGLAPLLFPAKPQWSKRTLYNSITPQAAGNPTQRD